jgi:hypothetical protein
MFHHRQHASVEDRIGQADATGLPNLPFTSLTPMPSGSKSSWQQPISTIPT